MKQAPPAGTREGRGSEAGFTLIEALTAIVVLAIGLVGVANLFVVAGSSNMVANQATAAASEATEVLERLKAIPFDQIQPGGDLDNNTGGIPNCDASTQDCVVAGNFNGFREVDGVARIQSRWLVRRPGAGGPDTFFIVVRSEAQTALGFMRTRAEYTTFRTCTADGCP